MSKNLARILPPYTRRLDSLGHRLTKAAVITAILAFAVVMGFWIAIFSTFIVPIFVAIIGLLFLIALWMADDTEPKLATAGAALMYSYWAITIVWPGYLAVQIPGLPWITPNRLVFAGTALVLLLQISQSATTRKQIVGTIICMRPAYIALAVMALFMFATSFVANSFTSAMGFSFQQLVLWTIPLLSGIWLLHDPRVVTKLAKVVGISMSIVFVLTLFEYLNKLPIWIPYIPSFLTVDAPQMDTFMSSQVRLDGSYRARGVFGIHLYYTQFILVTFPFVIHYTLDATSNSRRFWALVFLAVTLIVIWMNNTRTATTGQLVVIAGMLGLFGLRHYLHTRSKLDMTAPALAVGIPSAAALLAILIAVSPRLQTLTIGGTQHAGSDAVRDEQWQRAWSAVASNPFGYGSGGSGPLTGRLKDDIWIVDSTWINFLVDYGVFGALGWALFLGFTAVVGCLIYLQRADRVADLCGPAAVGIGAGMMTMYTISFVGNLPLIVFLVALISATRHRLALAGNLAAMKDIFQRRAQMPDQAAMSAARS